MASAYGEELKQAMRISTLKGFNRIMAATSTWQKSIWIMAVSTCFVVCMIFVSTTLHEFTLYPKVLTVEELLINMDDPNGTVPFPTVAVCSLNPFSSNASKFDGVLTPREYRDMALRVSDCDGWCADDKTRRLAGKLKAMLLSVRGYYMNVGMERMRKVGNTEFILDCKATIVIGRSFIQVPCEHATTNYTFVNPDYGVCYAYEMRYEKSVYLLGYTWVVHFDNTVYNLSTDYSGQYSLSKSSGVGLFAYNPFTVPIIQGWGATAGPGVMTNHYFRINRIDRLPAPYSAAECRHEEDLDEISFQGRPYNYDVETCMSRCILRHVAERCNCTDLFRLASPEDRPPRLPYCLDIINKSKEQLFETMTCVLGLSRNVWKTCHAKCPMTCREVEYEIGSTNSKWPLPAQMGSLYAEVIALRPSLREKYARFLDVGLGLAAGHTHMSELDVLLATKVIEDNFGEVNFHLIDEHYTRYLSKPKLTVGDLFSSLGSILNLWSGITVMFMVELVDIIIRMFKVFRGERSREHSSKHSGSQTKNANLSKVFHTAPLPKGIFTSTR